MKKNQVNRLFAFFSFFNYFPFSAWLCPVCNKPALYTDLFVDQFFIDVIGKCPPDAKSIEYEPNGQWKIVGEEKPSRRAQREKEAYKAAQAAKNTNGKSVADIDHSPSDDSDDERTHTSKFKLKLNNNSCLFY
jgi:hypothetical protein